MYYYIIIKDNKIDEFTYGEELPSDAIEVTSNWNGNIGDPIEFYNSNWSKKDFETLVDEGLVEMPPEHKWNSDHTKIVMKTDLEMYIDGDKPIPAGYKIFNNALVEMTIQEKFAAGIITQQQLDEEEIRELKNYLNDTDYVTIKIMEGVATKEEYAEVLTKREDARKRINELEA